MVRYLIQEPGTPNAFGVRRITDDPPYVARITMSDGTSEDLTIGELKALYQVLGNMLLVAESTRYAETVTVEYDEPEALPVTDVVRS